jgi:hypothetical protein
MGIWADAPIVHCKCAQLLIYENKFIVMNALFLVLGIVDIFAALLIFFPFSQVPILYIMVYMLVKGGYFLISFITTKNSSPLFMILSAVDIMTGVVLAAMVIGINSDVFKALGFISLVKGLYATISPIFS